MERLKGYLPSLTLPTDIFSDGFKLWYEMLDLPIKYYAQAIVAIFNNIDLETNQKIITQIKNTPASTIKMIGKKMYEKVQNESQINNTKVNCMYFVDVYNKVMRGMHRYSGKAIPEFDRPMNPVEEDYWVNYLMTEEEYLYYTSKTTKMPAFGTYNPKTRRNDLPNNFWEEKIKMMQERKNQNEIQQRI